MSERRWLGIEMPLLWMQEIFTTGYRFDSRIHVIDGLPKDAKFVMAFYSALHVPPPVIFVFEHASFPITIEGQEIPIKSITLRKDKNYPRQADSKKILDNSL